MASINDLATAATIASSAVALQQSEGDGQPAPAQDRPQTPTSPPSITAAAPAPRTPVPVGARGQSVEKGGTPGRGPRPGSVTPAPAARETSSAMEVDTQSPPLPPAAAGKTAGKDDEGNGNGNGNGDGDASSTVILAAPQISSSPPPARVSQVSGPEEEGGNEQSRESERKREKEQDAAVTAAVPQSPATVDGMDGVEETGPAVVISPSAPTPSTAHQPSQPQPPTTPAAPVHPPTATTNIITPTAVPAAAAVIGEREAVISGSGKGKARIGGVGVGVGEEQKRRPGTATTTTTTTTKPVRGAFIVFEGMDRAGKTTQAKLLQVRCVESGRDVRFMRFPDRTTPIGQMIDSYLKGESEIEDHVIHLLFAANRWEAVNKIKSDLAAGRTVVCDRFYHSGIVYSAAKQNPTLSLSWAKAPEVGLPRPDVVLFLDLEEEVARRRGGWGGEVYEKGEMQRRVRELFWGLSMGDLGNTVAAGSGGGGGGGGGGGNSTAAGNTNASNVNATGGGGAGGVGPAKSIRRDSGGVGGRLLGNGSVGGGAGFGGEEGEFRQEEEDIQIVDADLGIEELSDKVWEVALPRLEAVERGEVGSIVRTVR